MVDLLLDVGFFDFLDLLVFLLNFRLVFIDLPLKFVVLDIILTLHLIRHSVQLIALYLEF